MRIVIALVALSACNVPATHFTPLGGGDGGPGGDAGTPAHLTVSPNGDVTLGTVIIGQTSGKSMITVSNDGDQDSGALTLALDDTTIGFAVVDDTCSGKPLAGHNTCTFNLQFAPATAAALQTGLHVTAQPGGDIAKTLFGTGLTQGQIDIIETGFDFATKGLATATTHTFTVRNTGQAQAGMPVPSITGNTSFTVMTNNCTAPLNQSEMCTIVIKFSPGAVGGLSGSLVATSTPGGSDAAQLQGTGSAHVTVNRAGAGGGTVTSTQTGINCGAMCAADFTVTPITLNAAPDGTSNFAGWGNDCTGVGACMLDLTANRSVTATFAINKYPVSVSFTSGNPGPNAIRSTPAGINCDGTAGCTGNFDYNSTVMLTAVPDPNTGRFLGWDPNSPCAGQGLTCSFTMPASNVAVTGQFDWWGSMVILMNMGDPGFPTATTQVHSNDNQIVCNNTTILSGTCIGHYGPNAQVTLTYSGNPLTAWTSCKGGTQNKFLSATGSGQCSPMSGIICSLNSCATVETCTYTFTQPGQAVSEYDVACEQ